MTMMMMLITMMIMIMMMTLLMTMMKIIGTLRNCDVNKAIGLMSKTTTQHVHHAFLYISLLSLVNYDVR